MPCKDCDGRFNCPDTMSSACIDFTGKVSLSIKDKIACKPNLNDILEELQKIVDTMKQSLGDNRLLEKNCFEFNSLLITQEELNQLLLDKLCELQTAIANIGTGLTLDAANIIMEIDLMCVESGLCTPLVQYTLADILHKMVTKICNHETRITAIETFLGL